MSVFESIKDKGDELKGKAEEIAGELKVKAEELVEKVTGRGGAAPAAAPEPDVEAPVETAAE